MPWKLENRIGLKEGERLIEELEKEGYEIMGVNMAPSPRGPVVYVAAKIEKKERKRKEAKEDA